MGRLRTTPGQVSTTAAVLLLLFFSINGASAIHFTMLSTYNKCVYERLYANSLANVNFQVVDENPLQVSIQVKSPSGKVLYSEESVTKGEFRLNAQEEGDYSACFWVSNPPKEKTKVSVDIDWKTGVASKNYESIAKEKKIEGVELEFLRLVDYIQEIHENMLHLRSQEEITRHVTETTHSRVAWIGIASLFICVGVSGLQLWYLKSYFVRKKLL